MLDRRLTTGGCRYLSIWACAWLENENCQSLKETSSSFLIITLDVNWLCCHWGYLCFTNKSCFLQIFGHVSEIEAPHHGLPWRSWCINFDAEFGEGKHRDMDDRLLTRHLKNMSDEEESSCGSSFNQVWFCILYIRNFSHWSGSVYYIPLTPPVLFSLLHLIGMSWNWCIDIIL